MSKETALDYAECAELLKAIAHPVRLRMVAGLCAHDCNVSTIAERLKLPQSTVSQHLAILRSRGILMPQKDGVRTCYKVVEPRIAALVQALRG